MELTTRETAVVGKIRELCQAIVEEAGFRELMDKLDSFMSDPEAQMLYEQTHAVQEELYEKQCRSETIPDEEMERYNAQRKQLFANPIASNFIEAQQKMQKLQQLVSRYLTLTFELGRVPREDDLQAGGCGCGGGGCGCGSSG